MLSIISELHENWTLVYKGMKSVPLMVNIENTSTFACVHDSEGDITSQYDIVINLMIWHILFVICTVFYFRVILNCVWENGCETANEKLSALLPDGCSAGEHGPRRLNIPNGN